MIRSFAAVLALFVLAASITVARPIPRGELPTIVSPARTPADTPAHHAKAVTDTVWAYGGPDTFEGRFETEGGLADWQGWTHEDLTIVDEGVNHWHVSDYWAEYVDDKGIGNHALYCGDETIPACDPPDTVGGVGRGWWDEIFWTHTVPDTSVSTTVRLTGLMLFDLPDLDWDFLELWVDRNGSQDQLDSWTGTTDTTITLDYSTVFLPGDYTGTDFDEVRIFWRLWTSTDGWDDEDCINPSHGGCQIDDLSVFVDDSLVSFEDFESGDTGDWHIIPWTEFGVGDFTNLRNDLGDRDPCSGPNTSWQINWVDDGVVVPGTGGTPCIDYCYDPGGWIVNNDGGLLADHHEDWFLHNQVSSPPIAWPAGMDGAEFVFDVYRDELLLSDSGGVFFFWGVRSIDGPDPADLESAPWLDRNHVYNGGPDYFRFIEDVSDLLVPDATWVQVSVGVNELGWVWGWNSSNGTPAPYFDNVGLRAWDPQGPNIKVSGSGSFVDAFPSAGALDPADMAANSCFVDQVRNNNNGARRDSMVVELASLRHGATRDTPPVMHWVLKANDVFDPVRAGAPDGSGIVRGSLEGSPAHFSGQPHLDHWAFDLPDTGFFFPGDRLRWYITASDDVEGDVRTSVWPADTTGVAVFDPGRAWNKKAEINGLPTVGPPTGPQFPRPTALLIDAMMEKGDVSVWLDDLVEIGLLPGIDFDILNMRDDLVFQIAPSDLASYDTVILCNGSNPHFFQNGESDLWLDWLDLGGRRALFTGELVVRNLRTASLLLHLGVADENYDIADANGGFRELQVTPHAWEGVLPDGQAWRLSDGCPSARITNAITAVPGIGVMAASLDPLGTPVGSYAGLVSVEDGLGNRTLVMPFDLSRIEGYVGGGKNGLSPQAEFLEHLLTWLETGGVSAVGDDLPGVRKIAVSAHPNPFNPATTISFALPRAGAVTLEIFDIQGRKVRTLLDEQRFEAGRHEQPWDGRDQGGRGTSSGVYFYKFETGKENRVGKLTLLK